MGSAVFDWTSIEAKATAKDSTRKFFDSPTATLEMLECHVTTLKPGMDAHAPHQHPEEEIIILKEGTVESLINGEWKRVPAGSVISQSPIAGTQVASGSAVALYRGSVIETRLSALGWLLAQALRPIGAPLPLAADRDVPAVVSVSEDRASGGQTWTRIYGRHRRFPQVIHSAKRFAGSTGLEEYVGRGIGMALRVEAMADGLRFISDHYFLMLGHWRLRLPRWTEPGVTIVEHHDRGGGEFAFDLELRHRMFGVLVGQHAVFHDV